MKHLTLYRLASLLPTLYGLMQKSPCNSAKLHDTYVKAKTTKYFSFAMEIMEYNDFCLRKSLLLCVFFVKALRQWRQSQEAMKR
jgi:hypothetical protein